MNLDQLRLRYVGTVGRHWRSSLDQSGPTPAFLDDLCAIAQDYAEAIHAKEIGRAPVVAASPDIAAALTDPDPAPVPPVGPPSTAHRTRTRQRRNEQA